MLEAETFADDGTGAGSSTSTSSGGEALATARATGHVMPEPARQTQMGKTFMKLHVIPVFL